MDPTPSEIYTSTLGPWAFGLFLLGAFFVLYSTVFAAAASNSRVLVDFMELIRAIEIREERTRMFWRRVVVVALLLVYTTWYLWLGEPVQMVIIGGIAQACMLPVIAFSTLYLRYKFVEPALRRRCARTCWLTCCCGFARCSCLGSRFTR